MAVFARRQENDTVDLLGLEHFGIFLLLLAVLVTVTQNDADVLLLAIVLDAPAYFRRKPVHNVGNDDADRTAFASASVPGQEREAGNRGLNRFFDLGPRLLAICWYLLFRYWDTVLLDTPARAATSPIVAFPTVLYPSVR